MEPFDHLMDSSSDPAEPPGPRPLLTGGRLALALALAGALVLVGMCAAGVAPTGGLGVAPLRGSVSGGGVGLWDNYKWDGVWRDDSPHHLWHRDDVMNAVSKCQGPRKDIPSCQSTQCTQDGKYVLVGCIDGLCHHGIPDKKCKGFPNSQRYWHGWPLNEWCSDGRRDRKCPSPDFTGSRDNRWSVQEIIDRNLKLQASAEAGNAPASNSMLGSIDRRHLIPKVGEGPKPEHPEYAEGRIVQAEYYHHTWVDRFDSEAAARAACDGKEDCKGWWHRYSGEYYLLHAGARTFCKSHPDHTVVSVKGYLPASGATPSPAAARAELSSVCETHADCQTSVCNAKGFINHGCILQRCYRGTPDASCIGVANGKRYAGQQPGTWCWDNGRRDSRCPSKR